MSETPGQKAIAASSGKMSPRLALVGCGAIAQKFYLPALSRHPSVMEHLILVDRDAARAQTLAREFKVNHFLTDYRHVLGKVDGAIIAVPNHLHYPLAMEFLGRGVDVLCEKPLAESSDKARDMVELAQATGAVLAANFQRRLYPNLMTVKDLLANRSLGEPLSLQYFMGVNFDWPSVSGFHFNAELSSRGVLRDQGAHVIDGICWWLGGKPTLISSRNDSFGGSEAVAQVWFKHNRCTGEVKLSWLSKFPCRFVVECEAGTVEGDLFDYRGVTLKSTSGRARRVRTKAGPMSYSAIADTMVTNFLHVVTQNEEPLVAGSDVLDSVRFIDECYQAASRFEMPWYDIQEVQNGF